MSDWHELKEALRSHGIATADDATPRAVGGGDISSAWKISTRGGPEAWPLAEGHERRVALYQLYHVLNHLNMFGGSYLTRALDLIRELQRGTS
jgi:fructosamine-3-kinase